MAPETNAQSQSDSRNEIEDISPQSEGFSMVTSDPPLPSVESTNARSGRFLMQVVRLLFITLLVSVALLTVSSVKTTFDFSFAMILGVAISTTAVGIIVVVIDALTPNKRIAGVVGIYIGVPDVFFALWVDWLIGFFEVREKEICQIVGGLQKV